MPPSTVSPTGMDAPPARPRGARARPVAVPADAVLNFARYEQRPSSLSGSPPHPRAAARLRGTRSRRTREHFVTANCRFAVNPDKAGALTSSLSDADAPLDWDAVDVVFVERTTSAAEESAHQCTICLSELSCPQITPCGHVFCHVCLLQHVAHARTPPGTPLLTEPAQADSCVKCPLCAHLFALKSLRNVSFREVSPVTVGESCEMSLVSTAGRCTIAAAFAPGVGHSIPAHVESFERMFSRFVFASRSFLLDMLACMSGDLRDALADDRSLKPFVDQASRSVKAARQAIRRRSSPESRPATMTATAAVATTIDAQFSSSSLESDPPPIRKMSLDAEPRRASSSQSGTGPKLRLFYQSQDGQNIYLHPLCHRALLFEHDNDLSGAKTSISGRVIDSERFSMDEAKAKRYRFLKHLPQGCEVTLVELDLSSILSPKTLAHFSSEFTARKNARNRKAKESQKETARVSKMQTESLQDYFRNGNPRSENAFSNVTVDRNDEALFPALGGADAAAVNAAAVNAAAVNAGTSPPDAQPIPASGSQWGPAPREMGTSPGSAWGGAEISSYSSVASNMGLFPALGAAAGTVAGAVATTPPSAARGVWAPGPPAVNNGAWASSPPAVNNAISAGPGQGRDSRRHRRSHGRQTFTVFSNAGSTYRP